MHDFLPSPDSRPIIDRHMPAAHLTPRLDRPFRRLQQSSACQRIAFDLVIRMAALTLLAVFAERSMGQGYSPEEAANRMTVADGFEVQLIAAEPLVRQPVAIEFDDRGRLWTIQYLQYPNPAGLKRVEVDRYSRTRYDRLPDPPPRGTPGTDRITILEDTDGDGRADRVKDFVAGLNLASGLAFGHGGVFVLNAPYLLFYPDQNRDDVPDTDPEVLLTGFGMEDAHSVANSLTWGPDGWLYGCQGSTVTANIRGIEFQQGVWRYHPLSRKFELFCEGGGNSWGLDFDRHGELLYSTNFGGFLMLHAVQGGYYWKNFGKHGALHNPYTFGYFDHVPHENFVGGHVTVGGVVYQGDLFPPQFRGRYIAADLLGHAVYWNEITPRGSTFRTAHGGTLLTANDTWFAPSDVTVGPDGAVYVADWHDARTAHPDPDAQWDRRNGRIYRIQPRGAVRKPARDLRDASDDELLAALASPNHWYVRRARLHLAERLRAKTDSHVFDKLRDLVFAPVAARVPENAPPLEALWTLYCAGGLDDQLATRLLAHQDEYIRAWTVRLVGDTGQVAPQIARRFLDLAQTDPSRIVRRMLATTARRLPVAECIPIAAALATHDEDADDPYIPLLIWWAIEPSAIPARSDVLAQFATSRMWRHGIARDAILPRLMRRYALDESEGSGEACLTLWQSAPSATERLALAAALDESLRSRRDVTAIPAALRDAVAAAWRDIRDDQVLARVATRLGAREVQEYLVARALDTSANISARQSALTVLGEVAADDSLSRLVSLLSAGEKPEARSAALKALAHGADLSLAQAILAAYDSFDPALRSQARDVLLAKHTWAKLLLERVDTGQIDAKETPVDQLRVVAAHNDPALDALVRKHWGAIHQATAEERLAVARRLNNDLRAAAGDAKAGHDLFRKQCGICHTLFGEGEKIGPDLTTANRRDREFLLASIVDPSSVVRKEYANFNVQTHDGRALSGLIVAQDGDNLTLVTAKNERVRLARGDIEVLEESPQSLMPDNLAEQLTPQGVRDLFAWLEQAAPPDIPGGK